MTFDGVTFLLSVWGAGLSTGLGALEIWKFASRGPRLSTSYHLDSRADVGNTITLQNASETPAIVTYWWLVWATREGGRFANERVVGDSHLDDRAGGFTLDAHSVKTLVFRSDEYFDWGTKTRERGVLYLKLIMAHRRKAQWLKVYDPSEPPK